MKALLRLSLSALLVSPFALALAWQEPATQEPEIPELTPAELAAEQAAKDAAEKVQRELAAKAFKIADYDKNGWISFRELSESLQVDRPRYLVYDKDRNGKVTVVEFTKVSIESYRRYGAFKIPKPNPADPSAAQLLEDLNATSLSEAEAAPEYVPVEASSILELFGRPRPRVLRDGSVPEPDQLVGPVPSFRRLDQNNDGGISLADLNLLLLGSGLDDRPNELLASLDTNGDKLISEHEFRQCMASQP